MLRDASHSLAEWFETRAHSAVFLITLILLLYGWTLSGGFIIDDYRNLRLMREYHEGKRPELALYRFLRNDAETRALRAAGHYPWWVADDLRYQHNRPFAEQMLNLEYKLFGDHPLGYRIVGLAMYTAGVLMVLRLFRLLLADERLARWAALIYAVAASHAIGAVFIAMQCDLLGLLLAVGTMLSSARFIRDGRILAMLLAAIWFSLALGAKESSLPVALLPLCIWAIVPRSPGSTCRAMLSAALLSLIGAVWLVHYAIGGYGSNNAMMLDPLRAPGHYLAELPIRAGVLLSTWLLPINPFLFYLRPFGRPVIPIVACVGLLSLAIMVWLARRRGRSAIGMSLWAILFLPLLACTVPDDRNLLLPGVGLSMLAATWLTLPRGNAPGRRILPLTLFILLQIPSGLVVAGVLRRIERSGKENILAGLDAFARPAKAGDCIFFLNANDDVQLLFSQSCLDWLQSAAGRPVGVRVSFLCDIRNPIIEEIDDRTLRIIRRDESLLAGFIGAMGRTRAHDRREGDEYDAGEFRARITKMESGQIREVEIRLARPISDDAYRFLWCRPGKPPENGLPHIHQ